MSKDFVGKMVPLNYSMTQSEWQRSRDRHHEIIRLTRIALWLAFASSLIAMGSLVISLVALFGA